MSTDLDVKWAFTWFINVSLFSHILCKYYLIKPKERSKLYFLSYLKTKISVSEVHILSLFPESFSVFPWNLERMLPDNLAKNHVRNIYFLLLSKVNDHFSGENAYILIKTQSLTACHKETRHVDWYRKGILLGQKDWP